jgi:hypothetical protein
MMPSALLQQPPFCLPPGSEPGAAGAAIVASFRWLATAPAPLATAYAIAMRICGIAGEDPLHRAGMAAARDIDAGIGAGCDNGYHNRRHFCEVVLCALFLAQLAQLAQREQALVVLAALLHDFHHDGRPNGRPFRLEQQSLAAARPYLQDAGVGLAEQVALSTLVLATDSARGVPMARCCHGWHSGHMMPPPAPPLPQLDNLVLLPRLALMAALLAEADVLPSVALTIAHADVTTARLESEWGMTLGPRSKVEFIDRYIGDFQVARFFLPNLRAVRRISVQRAGMQGGSVA